MKRIVPGLSGSGHGIEMVKSLRMQAAMADLLGFSGGNEAVVELLDHGLEADGPQGSHVETAAHLSAPAEDGTLAAHLTGIAIKRRIA